MKKKFLIIILVVVLIIGGGIGYFAYSLKKDQRIVNDNMEKVNTYYEQFSVDISSLNEIRNNYSNIMSNVYYNTLLDKNNDIISMLDDYTDIINKVKENSSKLEGVCSNYYRDISVNQKCESYKVTWESANVYYKSDIKGYNNLIDKYNEYVDSDELAHYEVK